MNTYWDSKNPYWKPARLSEINARCGELWNDMINHADSYGLLVQKYDCGATVLDCGVRALSSMEAGRIITELCQGGLAKASLNMTAIDGIPMAELICETYQPAAGCIDMQMGLPFNHAVLSGSLRLFIEPLRFVTDDIPLAEAKNAMIGLIEPYAGAPYFSEEDALLLAEMAHIDPHDLKVIYAPGTSLAGATQVSGRAVEDVVLTIQRSLLIDSTKVVDIVGRAPVCPHYKDRAGSIRLDNDDFLHYVSDIYMAYYSEEGEDVQALAENLIFENVYLNGRYWGDIMDEVEGDFFKIPNITDINKIGAITINDLRTGTVYTAGTKNYEIIRARLLKA